MERRLVAVAGSGRLYSSYSSTARSSRRRWSRRRLTTTGGGAAAAGVALRRKVRELRRLVPGGEEAPARSLLVRTADYIVRLRARVELLRALSAFYDLPRHDGAGAGVPPRP